MKHAVVILVMLLFSELCAYGQNLTFHVYDSAGEISFVEFYINDNFLLSDENGVLSVKKESLPVNATITLKALGYETKKISVNESMLKEDSCIITLSPNSYSLDEVSVTKNFDAKSFFNKVKGWSKLYEKKHIIHVKAKYKYKKQDEQISGDGLYDILYQFGKAEFKDKTAADSPIRNFIEQAIEKAILLPKHYSVPRFQKYVLYEYMGMNDGFRVFKIKADKYNSNAEDESYSLAFLDSDGLLYKDDTEYIVHGFDKYLSYKISTKYSFNSEKGLMPVYINITLFIPEKLKIKHKTDLSPGSEVHIEMECSHE